MPSFCAVVNCNDRYGHSDNVSFHKFPLKRPGLLSQWETFIQQQRGADWRASRWSSLCSRHFREEDFRSLNERKTLKKSAVPSVLGYAKEKNRKHTGHEREEDVGDTEITEILAIKERLEDVGNAFKTNCRLCGATCIAAVMFSTNYELYGMLQKCFPTLNIQQEDDLPKALCASCNRNLQVFGEFVDKVWTAQAELQRKYKSRAVEKPLKIKQEPLVRVKQEVAEYGCDQNHHEIFSTVNEEYDAMVDGTHEDGEDSGTVDHKYEFCDFPIINDCDIMEIINLDDPFINIPDDDNTEAQELERTAQERINYLPSAHELLQEHLLMEEHNYAYLDNEDFKEERHVYKTEKTEIDERKLETPAVSQEIDSGMIVTGSCQPFITSFENTQDETENICNTEYSENRALKPVVTSVSAIQQRNKGNNIIVLNESIVKSGAGIQIHECMVCQLKFFSIGSLKEHYTQTHGTPMVSVPAANIAPDKPTSNTCKTEKEFSDSPKSLEKQDLLQRASQTIFEPIECFANTTEREKPNGKIDIGRQSSHTTGETNSKIFKNHHNLAGVKQPNSKVRIARQRERHLSLNTMASQYQQLKKLYQRLQRKCLNLEQNVEQLKLHPEAILPQKTKISNLSARRKIRISHLSEAKYIAEPDDKRPSTYTCPECSKPFSNSNSFRQHKITHTEDKIHACNLCHRSFKRRNGLLQHLKGFHLQVKPFVCPVCKHSYALKCDMLRCKHSALKASKCTE